MVTSPLASPLPSRGLCVSKVATSRLLHRGPCVGPNAQRGDENHKWLLNPCRLEFHSVGVVATSPVAYPRGPQRSARGQKSEMGTSPLLSRGSSTQTAGTKSEMATLPSSGQSGYTTPAVFGVPNVGTKSEVATSPMPS